MTSFEALSISAPILRALHKLSFDKPTEIQAAAIPCLKNGDDLIGVAQTGGGKTAAFVIPMLERLANHGDKPKPGMPRALILAPTRELAIQITDKIKELSMGSPAKCCTVYGGTPYRTQIHILRRGVDILVATPGRLKDHMKQGNIYLDEVEYFVLDEADRMLDMGFVDEVRDIARKLPTGHQSVMFSATMNARISELAATLLNEPTRVEVAREATIADNLQHSIMFVPGHQKRDLLLHLIEREEPEKALIFVRTRRDADQICEFMEAVGFKADAIHGDKKQNIRQRTINNFKADKFQFLVATDVAARGIDVKDITHVFNFDVPVEAESYVHRIGRTARGEAHGRAITLCGKGELRLLKDIESMLKMKVEVDFDNPYPLRLDKPKAQNFRDNRKSIGGGNKPWEKRAKKRAKAAGESHSVGRPAKNTDRNRTAENRKSNEGGKPWQKRKNEHEERSTENKPWKKRESTQSDRPTGKKRSGGELVVGT
ncbi:MAG: DEAD/DEAH box helicase, partial [Kordiimonas sp.]